MATLIELLTFWFDELTPEQWFKRDDATDELIRSRFLKLHEQIAAASPAAITDPDTAVATAIALDQLPRNMFRGTGRAFATDAAALAVARAAVAANLDQKLDRNRRLFLYLPFEHSERLADQDDSVRLISALGDADYTRYAVAHRDVILRFGRFPHRNAALGRVSTPAELAYLTEPGSGF